METLWSIMSANGRWIGSLMPGLVRSTAFKSYKNKQRQLGRTLETSTTLGALVDVRWPSTIPGDEGGWEAGYGFSHFLFVSSPNRSTRPVACFLLQKTFRLFSFVPYVEKVCTWCSKLSIYLCMYLSISLSWINKKILP